MIFENAYLGLTPMLRAYFGGKLVWEKSNIVEILPKTQLSLTQDSISNCYVQSIDVTEGLVSGNVYIVIWDNVMYTLRARDIDYKIDHPAITDIGIDNAVGNAMVVTSFFKYNASVLAEVDTHEEFLCNYSSGAIKIWCANNNEHTIRIYYEKLED